MSRHSSSGSYGHTIAFKWGDYVLYWTVDFYYTGSRQRFPRRFHRWTDHEGAKRFAKKHNVAMPKTFTRTYL